MVELRYRFPNDNLARSPPRHWKFDAAGEPLDVLSYIARGPDQGRFFYRPANGTPAMIRNARQASKVTVKDRPLLVKLHGSIDRRNPEAEKLVLTEDDYLSYLARTNVAGLPPAVEKHLVSCPILFIGYALAIGPFEFC